MYSERINKMRTAWVAAFPAVCWGCVQLRCWTSGPYIPSSYAEYWVAVQHTHCGGARDYESTAYIDPQETDGTSVMAASNQSQGYWLPRCLVEGRLHISISCHCPALCHWLRGARVSVARQWTAMRGCSRTVSMTLTW